MTPSARTKKYLEDMGYLVHRVEYWNAFAKKRIDVYGFGDFLSCHPSLKRIVLVQATSLTNMSSHRNKINDSPKAKIWKKSGGKIELHGWYKAGVKIEEL